MSTLFYTEDGIPWLFSHVRGGVELGGSISYSSNIAPELRSNLLVDDAVTDVIPFSYFFQGSYLFM